MIRKVLVANRGEIAVRIIRACRELGVATVAVYSDVDRESMPVLLADEARHIGPAAALESYLDVDKVLDAARETGADAIHPGYGFLSENAGFAERCVEAGIKFIGPSPDVMRSMGLKVEARDIAREAGVPLIEGSPGAIDDEAGIVEAARKIGLPVLIKASAGGGGKGMRIVRDEADLGSAAEAARREAQAAFGNPAVFVEKYVEKPRHIEIQVLADEHGNAVHLGERECSIQRRHQKIVEETPSTVVDADLRARMGAAALDLVKRVGYTSAGTVEFLLDDGGNFYFLEMNTRIQVEHPITELVMDVDLVQWQIRIASGETLSLRQEDLTPRGHAIECRIYAEDPLTGFLPSPGTILHAHEADGPGVRSDSAVLSGMTVTPDYDPILSKLVVWAEDRNGAIRRMRDALKRTVVLGVETPIRFLADVLAHPDFAAGRTTTDFIDKNMSDWGDEPGEAPDEVWIAAAMDAALRGGGRGLSGEQGAESAPEPWATIGRFEIGGA